MSLDEILWSLAWSASLRPELPMIPDRRVFLHASSGRSLTATVEGVPSLLLSLTDLPIEHLSELANHKELHAPLSTMECNSTKVLNIMPFG